ncbi:hypothetical protein JHK82_042710 [Glycine max]|nr:hypothetical protein JHK82_042710 [Glycine max]
MSWKKSGNGISFVLDQLMKKRKNEHECSSNMKIFDNLPKVWEPKTIVIQKARNMKTRTLDEVLGLLHKRILNFCPLTNNKGETIGKKIEKCLEGWLIGRVFSITVDNVSSNDVAISYLKSGIEDWNTNPLKEEKLHVRYCAHILNLVVNDGLKEYHSSIRKIRSAVKYVRASPDRMDRFKIFIKEAKLVEKSIMQLDVSTRLNSTYIMLESALKFQKVFKRLGEKFSKYVILNDSIPNNEDCKNTICFTRFSKIVFDITHKVSKTNFVTSIYFNEHCKVLQAFQKWIKSSDPLFGSMAENMKKSNEILEEKIKTQEESLEQTKNSDKKKESFRVAKLRQSCLSY